MRQLLSPTPFLEWIAYNKIRWSGKYEVLHITDEAFNCKLGNWELQVEGEEIIVEYLAEQSFIISMKRIQRLTIKDASDD
ncbi:hypothetical protein [Lysinibacillus sp. 54212]|uniref:hypothetical protein n=1 Tax=Lysinibacillus sp. 54212 TaxID=3119829 RepID=UPI002FCAF292